MRRTKRGGWPYSQPPNVQFEINWDSQQADGLVLWMPWGGGTPGAHRHVDRVNGLVFTEGGTPVWVTDGERGWSMLFDLGNNEYLQHAGTVVSGPPLTLMYRVYPNNVTGVQVGLSMGDLGGASEFSLMVNGAGAGDPISLYTRDGGGGTHCATTTGVSINTWHHACGIARSPTDRAALVDGGSKGTSNVARTPVDLDTTMIGRSARWAGFYISARITDARIYNVAKTDAEVYQIATEPWELCKPLIRRWLGWKSPAPPPVGGHMTLWGRYWGP